MTDVCRSERPAVCLLHACIVSKQLNISLHKQCSTVAKEF